MTPDIQELRRLAEAADGVIGHSYESHKALARYSAAASPSTILALIEVVEAAEKFTTVWHELSVMQNADPEATGSIQRDLDAHEAALRTALEGVRK